MLFSFGPLAFPQNPRFCHKIKFLWLNWTFGPISNFRIYTLGLTLNLDQKCTSEQFEIGPKVEFNHKICNFGESHWTKPCMVYICRHVITSFYCFSGPKLIPLLKSALFWSESGIHGSPGPGFTGPKFLIFSVLVQSGSGFVRGSLIRIVQQGMYRWF